MLKRIIALVLILGLLPLTGFSNPEPPRNPPQLGPDSYLTSAGPDEYGYSLYDEGGVLYEDISLMGMPIIFDSEGIGQINIVTFKFYELTNITSAYVNIDGLISFVDPRPTRLTNINKPFPMDSKPNAMLSAFWFDITLESGSSVLQWNYPSPDPDPRTIVQWNNVKAGAFNLVTFQVILHSSGRIDFAYAPISTTISNVTAGIEDPDGVIGLNYAIPADLSAGKRVVITRPSDGAHVKARPQVSSGMLQNGEAWYLVNVTNITNSATPSDTYDLTFILEDANPPAGPWDLVFYNPTCTTINATNMITVAKGATQVLCMRVSTSGDLIPGYFARHKVTITSQTSPSQSSSIYLQSSISTPFVQLYQDSTSGLKMDIGTSQTWESLPIANPYNGSHMAMNMLWPGHYMITWLESGMINYRLYNQFTQTFSPNYQISASSYNSQYDPDLSPAVVASRDGHIGILFIVNEYRMNGAVPEVLSNIFFAMLGSDGSPVGSPRCLTDNGCITNNGKWLDLSYGSTIGAPQFFDPQIVSAGSDGFALVWRKQLWEYLGSVYDLVEYAIVKTNGSDPFYSEIFGWDDLNRHVFPAATGLEDGRFLIAFSNYNFAAQVYSLNYQIINSDGSQSIPSPTIIPNTNAVDIDIVQLVDGEVFFAWSNISTGKTAFAILGDDLVTMDVTPVDDSTDLTYEDYTGHQNLRTAGDVSVTRDIHGNAILTWQDADWQEQLYYTVMGSDGTVVTPPMLYRRVGSSYPKSQLSTNGFGNAPLVQNFYFMPAVSTSSYKYYFSLIS